MAFDTAGAIAAGYTQDEINNYLRSKQGLTKAENIPILGSIIKPVSKVIRGAVAGQELKNNLDTVSGSSQSQQALSLAYAKRAQTETDPIKKKQLLEKSKSISRGATEQLEGYINPNLQVMPEDYAKGEGNYLKDSISAGIAVGTAASIPSAVKGTISTVKNLPKTFAKTKENLNLFKKWGEAASKAADGKPFNAKQLEKALKVSSGKLSGKDKVKFMKLVEEEALNPIVNNAKVALDVRRNLKPASFIKKAIFGESVAEKFKLAKYAGINEQLKLIPELAKYDKYIATLSKVTKVAKPIIYGKILTRIFGTSGTEIIKGATGQ